MEDFSKIIKEKSDTELSDIGERILDFQAQFIIDYFSELDERGLFFDYKILLSSDNLISIALKIKDVSNDKYYNILKKEIDIRNLNSIFDQILNEKSEATTKKNNTKWHATFIDRSIELFFIISLIIAWILYKQGIIFNQGKKNEHKTNHYIHQPQHQLPKIEIKTIKEPNQKIWDVNSNTSSNKIDTSATSSSLQKLLSTQKEFDPKVFENFEKTGKYEQNELYKNPKYKLKVNTSLDTNNN
jgi:hypothetical protein